MLTFGGLGIYGAVCWCRAISILLLSGRMCFKGSRATMECCHFRSPAALSSPATFDIFCWSYQSPWTLALSLRQPANRHAIISGLSDSQSVIADRPSGICSMFFTANDLHVVELDPSTKPSTDGRTIPSTARVQPKLRIKVRAVSADLLKIQLRRDGRAEGIRPS